MTHQNDPRPPSAPDPGPDTTSPLRTGAWIVMIILLAITVIGAVYQNWQEGFGISSVVSILLPVLFLYWAIRRKARYYHWIAVVAAINILTMFGITLVQDTNWFIFGAVTAYALPLIVLPLYLKKSAEH